MIDNERAVLCFSIYECRLVSGVVVVLFSPFRSDCSWLVVLLAVDLWLYCGYCQRCCTVALIYPAQGGYPSAFAFQTSISVVELVEAGWSDLFA